jgi:two-component system nitrogen regulation sensor histidine kinase NtrY
MIFSHRDKNRIVFIFGVLLFVFVSVFYALSYVVHQKYQPDKLVKSATNKLYKTESQCITASQRMYHLLNKTEKPTWGYVRAQSTDIQTSLLVYVQDSLIYWSSNQLPLEQVRLIPDNTSKIVFSGNQVFLVYNFSRGKYTILTFVPLQGKTIPYGLRIQKGVSRQKPSFYLKKFGISFTVTEHTIPPHVLTFLYIFYLLSWLSVACLLITLQEVFLANFFQRFSVLQPFVLLVELLFIRILQHHLTLPAILLNSFWTTENLTSIPYFLTPGDCLTNLLFLSVFLFVFFTWLKENRRTGTKKSTFQYVFIATAIFLFVLVFFILLERVIGNGGLVFASQLDYLNGVGLLRLFLLTIFNLIVYLWVRHLLYFVQVEEPPFYKFLLVYTVIAALMTIVFTQELVIILIAYAEALLLSVLLWYIKSEVKPYFHTILAIFILSLFAAVFLNYMDQKNQNAHQQYAANILTQKQDPYLEFLLKTESKQMLQDTTILRLIRQESPDRENRIKNYINKQYLSGVVSSYTKQFTLCLPGQKLEIQPDNRIVECAAFFRAMQGKLIDSTARFQLSLIDNTNESIYYLAQLKYPKEVTKSTQVNLYIEFYTNIIPKGLGYPELLQSKGTKEMHLSGYSFAFYKSGKLEYKLGDFLYPVDILNFENLPGRTFFKKENYIHYMVPIKGKEKLIVSRKAQNLSAWLMPFSLLFIISGLLVVFYISIRFGRRIRETFVRSFSTRLQLSIFSAMLLLFVTFTVIIIYYFNAANQQTISNNLKEKTHSVIIEVQDKLTKDELSGFKNKEQLQSFLQKFSKVFFSDINIYNRAGQLLVSSRPEIFSENLQSRLMNPQAYDQIVHRHKLFYLGKERIKQVQFYSSYAPLILPDGQESAIINLPYFARQSELQSTYYQMMANLINLFVIAGILSMLLLVYLSRLLTRPLSILQHKIGKVSIDKPNEKIEWKRHDEIGKLIEAYNTMVESLDESARLLKYSARETAWREMARQIAHEIRNPLTPMKLNVQYLQRVYMSEETDFNEKFKTISQSLINQIDALNEIVDMFSDFSKVKMPTTEKANLLETLSSTADLYKKSYGIKIDFTTSEENLYVALAKKDLLRIFNNLFKNAAQSMEGKENKNIQLEVIRKQNFVEIQLADNGKGMTEEEKSHIFQPYFTTKTKGTGLGLAIVKNLITEAGGEIKFFSEKNLGTTFIIKIPVWKEDRDRQK